MQRNLKVPGLEGVYLAYEYAAEIYAEDNGTSKGGTRIGLYQWNNGTQGTVGTRSDCDHQKKQQALEKAKEGIQYYLQTGNIAIGYGKFKEERKERNDASFKNRSKRKLEKSVQ